MTFRVFKVLLAGSKVLLAGSNISLASAVVLLAMFPQLFSALCDHGAEV